MVCYIACGTTPPKRRGTKFQAVKDSTGSEAGSVTVLRMRILLKLYKRTEDLLWLGSISPMCGISSFTWLCEAPFCLRYLAFIFPSQPFVRCGLTIACIDSCRKFSVLSLGLNSSVILYKSLIGDAMFRQTLVYFLS